MNATNNQKQIFQVGDRVYDFQFGWVTIYSLRDKEIVIKTDETEMFSFKNDAIRNRLSFTEYTLSGFSQERPINYNDYIGKWGFFWDEPKTNMPIVAKLKDFSQKLDHKFMAVNADAYHCFKPLTDEQIKILELE